MLKTNPPPFCDKLEAIQKKISNLSTPEALYKKIMEWGEALPPFPAVFQQDIYLVSGCQSTLYLQATYEEGRVYFAAGSDALLSKGLAAMLIELYEGETPETILTTPPTFFETTGILTSLTPGRANGFAALYLKMKQLVLPFLLKKT